MDQRNRHRYLPCVCGNRDAPFPEYLTEGHPSGMTKAKHLQGKHGKEGSFLHGMLPSMSRIGNEGTPGTLFVSTHPSHNYISSGHSLPAYHHYELFRALNRCVTPSPHSASGFTEMSSSSSRFHNLEDDFEHYAFMSLHRIHVRTADETATVHMGAMIQVTQGSDTSTSIRYRIATLSSGDEEAIAKIVAGVESYLPKDATIQAWEADFDLRSDWKDKAVIMAAWSEGIASAAKGFTASSRGYIMSGNESGFREELVHARRSRTDDPAKSAVTGDSKSVTGKHSTLCVLIAPPIVFEGSHLPTTQQESSNSSSFMWQFPCVSFSADQRVMVLGNFAHTKGFKPKDDPVNVALTFFRPTDTIGGWKRGILSNESPRILAALDSFRETLTECASSTLAQFDLHHVDNSEYGPYVSNTQTCLIDMD
ncbi:hypothetical protein EHS25_008547 [Saitozyma podzolica]|uniref:Uncharacterized protein n=1 Tax=Saitozyma podzolica TaxID=1890683 RepID=A0A427YLZ5_9TREE|nr:hypothetical protein EHS25_008547 [Saitozyma podzolica]